MGKTAHEDRRKLGAFSDAFREGLLKTSFLLLIFVGQRLSSSASGVGKTNPKISRFARVSFLETDDTKCLFECHQWMEFQNPFLAAPLCP